MLLKTTLELKAYFSSIDKDYNFNSIKSFVLDAESQIIIPEVGQEMYDVVKAAYDANTLSGDLLQLHVHLQRAITHLALYFSSDSGSFHISDGGYYVTVTADAKPVSDKKMAQFRKGRAEAGYKALDQALLLMEQKINAEVFAPYKNAAVRQLSGGLLISSPIDFTRIFSPLRNSGTTFRAMLSAIDQAEQQHLAPLLGDELFEDLKSKILSGTLGDQERNLVSRIQKPLAYFSIVEAIPMTGFEFDGKTFSICTWAANNDNIEVTASLSDQRLSGLMNACMITGERELARLKTFLEKHAGDFPLYQTTGSSDFENNPNDSGNGFYFV